MRNETTIDGVRLTRGQVERALEELNKQEFRAGDLVSCKASSQRFLVMGGVMHARASAVHGLVPRGFVRVTDGLESFTLLAENLVLIP